MVAANSGCGGTLLLQCCCQVLALLLTLVISVREPKLFLNRKLNKKAWPCCLRRLLLPCGHRYSPTVWAKQHCQHLWNSLAAHGQLNSGYLSSGLTISCLLALPGQCWRYSSQNLRCWAAPEQLGKVLLSSVGFVLAKARPVHGSR